MTSVPAAAYSVSPCSTARVRSDWTWAVILSAVVLALGCALRSPTIGYDGEEYLTYARNLLVTGSLTYDGVTPSCGRSPGYPLILAGILRVFGTYDWVYPAQVAMLLIAYWFVARSLWGQLSARAAAAAIVLLSLIVPMHRFATAVVAESWFLAITAAAVYLLHRWESDRRWPTMMAAGLLLGLSAYLRPVTVLAAPFLGGYLIWRRRLTWRQGAVLALSGLLIIAPWTYRNWRTFHRVVPMAAHHGSIYYMTDANIFWPVLLHSAGYTHTLPVYREIVGDNLELDWKASERYWACARRNISADPFGFIGRCVAKTVFVWGYLPGTKGWIFTAPWLFAIGVLVQLLFLIVAFKGLAAMRTRAPTLADTIIGYVVYTTLVLFPLYAESRFLIPVYVWLFGAAWCWFAPRLARWPLVRMLRFGD